MKEITITWYGTVSGKSTVEVEDGETVEDAIKKAIESESSIDMEELPTDWAVDMATTLASNL